MRYTVEFLAMSPTEYAIPQYMVPTQRTTIEIHDAWRCFEPNGGGETRLKELALAAIIKWLDFPAGYTIRVTDLYVSPHEPTGA